jgi:hypothetical protein
MFCLSSSSFAGALTGVLLALTTSNAAMAAPLNFAGPAVVAPTTLITEVRYRRRIGRHYGRRNDAAGAAVLGLFGTVLGAAIANNGYNNYSYQSYGYPNDYGYGPGYGSAGAYGYGSGRSSTPRHGFGGRGRSAHAGLVGGHGRRLYSQVGN